MLKKSKYIYEKELNNKLFVLNLLTFRYLVLNQADTDLWNSNNLLQLEKYDELIAKYFIVEEDSRLFNLAIEKLSIKGNRNPNHVIFITDECNQKCTYCFEKSINVLGKRNKVLTNEQVDKIISTIMLHNLPDRKNGSITLFGGEPLLKKNKAIVSYLLKSCVENRIPKIDIVTNGITLDHYLDTLNEYNSQIRSLIVTLNGYKEMHDIVRGSTNSPTFDIIFNNIKTVLESIKNIQIRINILLNRTNIGEIYSLISYLYNENILSDKRVSVAFGRIQFRAMPENNSYDLELPYEEYYSNIIEYYDSNELIKDDMIEGSEVSILSKLYKFWKGGKLAYPELKGCTAIYPGRFCYFIDGNIYPCTEIAGVGEFSIGNYMGQGIDYHKYNVWDNYKVTKLKKCESCKYIGLCNGGCPVSNMIMNQDINEVYCLNIEKSLDNFIEALHKKGYFNENS